MHSKSFVTFMIVGLVALFSVLPTSAQTPIHLALLPTWSTSSFVMTSFNHDADPLFPSDNGDNIYNPAVDDEVNYVALNLPVTTSSEIWAFDMTCNLGSALEVYPTDTNGTTDNPTDDEPSFRPSAAWGIEGTDYTQVNFPIEGNKLRIVISRMGQIAGLGINGQEQSFSLGTVMLRVKHLPLTFENTFLVLCTHAFINRNAVPLSPGGVTPIAPLLIRAGYSISGVVTQQGQPVGAGIGVSCEKPLASAVNQSPTFRTNSSGMFRVMGLRPFGYYRCQYFANLLGVEAPSSPADKDLEPFLAGQSYVPLFTTDYTLQPVVLRAGNTAHSANSEIDVDLADISAVTAAYGATGLPAAFDMGDANGDRNIDNTDLVLVTSNYGVSEYVSQGHYLFAGQIQPATGSRVHIATTPDDWSIPDLRQLIPGTSRDLWPAISPDGSQIAFIRSVGGGTSQRFALYVMSSNGSGTPTRITPANADYDAFAPSWSPDGKRIAFIRTPITNSGGTLTRTYGIDLGWLTLVGTGPYVFNLDLNIETRIYPPTWANSDQVIYGSTVTNTLETLYIQANTTQAVDESTQGSGFEDMPNFINGHLYYRYEPDGNFATVDAELRFATPGITFDGYATGLPVYTTSPVPVANSFPYHITVPTEGKAIAYYSVDGARETLVMQYVQDNYSNGYWQSAYLTNASAFATATPIWFGLATVYSPMASNPSWNGDAATTTDLHALRSIIRWLP